MTDEATYDFVVVGAGQNHLTAAAYLAAAGNSVLVLERLPFWGGGCITQEATVPGFKHDLHATNIFIARANPLIHRDELGLVSRFGLKYAVTDAASHGTVFPDGSVAALFPDLERTCESIGRYSLADSRAYGDFLRTALKYMGLLSFAFFAPPADGARFVALLKASEEGRYLLKLFTASALDVVEEHFQDARTKVHLLRLTSELMMCPDSPGTAFALLFMAGLYHSHPTGLVVGGSQGFSDALVRCLRHHGGVIQTESEVRQVLVERGRATGVELSDGRRFGARLAVVAGLPPWRLSEYVEGTEHLTEKVRRVPNSDFTCFLTHLALTEPAQPSCDPAYQTMVFTVVAPADVEAMLRMARDATRGVIPTDFSACFVCATNQDPSRAPAGNATLYLYRIVPRVLAGKRLEGWEEVKEATGRALIEQTRRFVPNLTDEHILGVMHESPADIQRHSPSYLTGDVAALAMTADQFLHGRPIPELAEYRVPGVEGLYLCGPFMHPGGGANGGGRPVAMRVMMDLKMDLGKVFRL